MADKITTQFPKVGTGQGSDYVDLTSVPSRNTMPIQRKYAPGGMIEAATASHRPNIAERLGAKLHPTATLYGQNAAEASMVTRNVHLVPSAVGNRDFYNKRQYGQVMQ